MIRQDMDEARALVERVRQAQLAVNDMVDMATIDIGLNQVQKALADLKDHHAIGSSAHVLAMLASIGQQVEQVRQHLGLTRHA